MTQGCFGEVTYFCFVGSKDTGVRRHCPKCDMIQLSKHGLFTSFSHYLHIQMFAITESQMILPSTECNLY